MCSELQQLSSTSNRLCLNCLDDEGKISRTVVCCIVYKSCTQSCGLYVEMKSFRGILGSAGLGSGFSVLSFVLRGFSY